MKPLWIGVIRMSPGWQELMRGPSAVVSGALADDPVTEILAGAVTGCRLQVVTAYLGRLDRAASFPRTAPALLCLDFPGEVGQRYRLTALGAVDGQLLQFLLRHGVTILPKGMYAMIAPFWRGADHG